MVIEHKKQPEKTSYAAAYLCFLLFGGALGGLLQGVRIWWYELRTLSELVGSLLFSTLFGAFGGLVPALLTVIAAHALQLRRGWASAFSLALIGMICSTVFAISVLPILDWPSMVAQLYPASGAFAAFVCSGSLPKRVQTADPAP